MRDDEEDDGGSDDGEDDKDEGDEDEGDEDEDGGGDEDEDEDSEDEDDDENNTPAVLVNVHLAKTICKYVTIHMAHGLFSSRSHIYSTLTHISHAYDSSFPHLLHCDSSPPIVLLLYIRLDTHL